MASVTVTPPAAAVANPAFDVTPARLVTGLITERGVATASPEGLARAFPRNGRLRGAFHGRHRYGAGQQANRINRQETVTLNKWQNLDLGLKRSPADAGAGGDLDLENTLYLELKDGRVVIQLRPDLAPNHVARIKALARAGFYDGIVFHRVIDGFMAQTGDPTGTGTGGSGQNLRAEFSNEPHVRGACLDGPCARPEQRRQPVLHRLAAGAASRRPVHALGSGVSRHGSMSTRIKKGGGNNGDRRRPGQHRPHACRRRR